MIVIKEVRFGGGEVIGMYNDNKIKISAVVHFTMTVCDSHIWIIKSMFTIVYVWNNIL